MSEQENAMDYQEHDNSYKLFINIAKYGSIFTILLLIFIAFIAL